MGKNVNSIQQAVDDMNHIFGSGTVQNFEDGNEHQVQCIPSGSISLDGALGGGYPQGRIIEIYGPESSGKTTLAMEAAVQTQKLGYAVLFLDMENAFDPSYGEALGLDFSKEKWIFSQPECGEDAFTILEKFVGVSDIGLIIIDSVAVMIPRAELEGEYGESKMGLHARLMSQGMRKLVGKVKKSDTTVMFINQTRQKIGVVFGCMHSNTILHTVDGRFNMREVVNNKLNKNLISYNIDSKLFEECKIEEHFYNGEADNYSDFISIKFETNVGQKFQKVILTKNHKLLTQNGWVEAQNLDVENHKLLTYVDNVLNTDQEQVLLACMLGDGVIKKRTRLSYKFSTHENKHNEYTKYKSEILNSVTEYNLVLKKYYDKHYLNKYSQIIKNSPNSFHKYRIFDESIINDINLIGLGFWFLDDGHSSVKRYIKDGVEFPRKTGVAKISIKRMRHLPKCDIIYLMDLLVERIKIIGYDSYYKIGKSVDLIFDIDEFKKFSFDIREFTHTSMQYKLLQNDRGYFDKNYISDVVCDNRDKVWLNIFSIDGLVNRDKRSLKLFDIKTDISSYMVGSTNSMNGVVVHNSPEVTTGGMALQFYASQRLRVGRKKGTKTKDGELLSNIIKVNVVKNKIAPPHKMAEFQIRFGEGIDIVSEIIEIGVEFGILTKRGSHFSYGDIKLGQGAETVRELLIDNEELKDELIKTIEELL